jgi:hypothetical protein
VEEQKLENKINYQRYWLAKLKGFERERNSKKPVDEMAEKEKVKELQRMKSLKQQQMLLIE